MTCATCEKPLLDAAGACPTCGALIGGDPALEPTVAAPIAALQATQLAPKQPPRPPPKRKPKSPAKPHPRDEADPFVGKVLLGQYVVLKRLSEGGMGAVYEADQAAMGRKAVIKVLRPELSNSRESASRFDVEARAASQLNHPHIVTIYNYGATDDGTLFLAMEHLEGGSLQQVLRDGGVLPIGRAASIARQIGAALGEAHRHGVVHRDLKPSNVMLVRRGDADDFVKVLDFGIAKVEGVDLTVSGFVCGTPPYMSPEQFRGGSVDRRSDLYSLGIVMFEMLAGKPPFSGTGPLEYMNKHVNETPPRLRDVARKVPDSIDAVVAKLLAKDPDDRPSSAEAFLRELDEALAPRPTDVDDAAAPTAALVLAREAMTAHLAVVKPQRIWKGVGRTWVVFRNVVTHSVHWIWEKTGGRLRRRKRGFRGSVSKLLDRVRIRRRQTLKSRARKMKHGFKAWLRRVRR